MRRVLDRLSSEGGEDEEDIIALLKLGVVQRGAWDDLSVDSYRRAWGELTA
jgi:hypothetical protein